MFGTDASSVEESVTLASKKKQNFEKMNDREVLDGYCHHSRYASRNVFSKYGLHPGLYKVEEQKSKRLKKLKERLSELVNTNKFVEPTTGNQLRELLGPNFGWVKSSMDP